MIKHMSPITILAIYLVFANIVSFYLMWDDKRRAIKKNYRIPEKTLILWAAAGGSIGSMLGMKVFRHKTRHIKFSLGIPAILLVQLILIVEYIYPSLA